MRQIVINKGYGGFGLSQVAIEMLKELGVNTDENGCGLERDDLRLVKVVKTIGGIEANDDGDEDHFLKIVSIPNYVDWEIKEYDGDEWVAEKHRIWGR